MYLSVIHVLKSLYNSYGADRVVDYFLSKNILQNSINLNSSKIEKIEILLGENNQKLNNIFEILDKKNENINSDDILKEIQNDFMNIKSELKKIQIELENNKPDKEQSSKSNFDKYAPSWPDTPVIKAVLDITVF